jgi:hypothetical protein
MSEFMKQFNSGSGGGARSGRGPLQTNLCLQISGHDLSAPNGGVVQGVVVAPAWLAGDQVAVRLMNEAESMATFRKDRTPTENRKFFDKSRPSIEKLMTGFKVGRNDIPAMNAGGYLMMYGCTKDHDAFVEGQPQVWKAQYAENYGNDPSRDILHGVARVSIEPATETSRAYGNIDILFPRAASLIQSIDDLRGFFEDCMDGQLNGTEHNAQAVIRLIANNGNVKSFFTYSARQEVEFNGEDGQARRVKVPASAEQTWKEAVEDGVQARGGIKMIAAALSGDYTGLSPDLARSARTISADLAKGDLKIEAMPGRRIPLVGDSLEWAMDPSNKLARQAKRCEMKQEDPRNPGAENARTVLGYVGMTVGVMAMAPRADGLADPLIVTKFSADEFAKAKSVNYIVSKNFEPQYSRERDQKAANEAAAAGAQGGVAQSEYEEPDLGGDAQQVPEADREHEVAPGM